MDTHIAVIRAATVCKRWCAVASTRGTFVPGHRNEFFDPHPGPHVLGHYHVADPSYSPAGSSATSRRPPRPVPVFVPASPSINARHFSLNFLPRGHGGRLWKLVDGRSSLLLLANQRRNFFPDLVVCEPITWRHVVIGPLAGIKCHACLGVYLSDHVNMTDDDTAGVLAASDDGRTFWDNLRLPDHLRDLQDGISNQFRFVDNGVEREYPPVVRLATMVGDELRVLKWNLFQSLEWELEQRVNLHEATRGLKQRKEGCFGRAAKIVTARKGFVVLTPAEETWLFSVDLRTMQVEHDHCQNRLAGEVYPYELVTQPLIRASGGLVGVECEYPPVARLATVVGDELRVLKWNLFQSQEWELERRVNLPEATHGLKQHKEGYFGRAAKIVTARKGFVVLTPAEETWLFFVDLRTMQVECDHCQNRLAGEAYTYELVTQPQIRAVCLACKTDRRGPCSNICKCN
ncbi:hypothetical protein PR202_ga16153 [Eleusine coracana subsp. coracana]|uniref:DUF1618 domain-containing protein n=1 Tax=Eleusine coracana subsp. coracana TaxID=191504 RepID=A0AAV5CLW8_ELECO|nr:hypothetical protein PR202_ga16153 [Eleusine coracana subsp. coracana]